MTSDLGFFTFYTTRDEFLYLPVVILGDKFLYLAYCYLFIRSKNIPPNCYLNLICNFSWFTEIDMMKERFAKLLLGEDMSGGGKGVCTALAISNAITNLSGQ